jgi:hypothetical protein
MTKAEQETIVRWDPSSPTIEMGTANPRVAQGWSKLGFDVRIQDRAKDGTPRFWRTEGPRNCIRFRRVANGQIVKRANAGKNLSMYRNDPGRTRAAKGDGYPVAV